MLYTYICIYYTTKLFHWALTRFYSLIFILIFYNYYYYYTSDSQNARIHRTMMFPGVEQLRTYSVQHNATCKNIEKVHQYYFI